MYLLKGNAALMTMCTGAKIRDVSIVFRPCAYTESR